MMAPRRSFGPQGLEELDPLVELERHEGLDVDAGDVLAQIGLGVDHDRVTDRRDVTRG